MNDCELTHQHSGVCIEVIGDQLSLDDLVFKWLKFKQVSERDEVEAKPDLVVVDLHLVYSYNDLLLVLHVVRAAPVFVQGAAILGARRSQTCGRKPITNHKK